MSLSFPVPNQLAYGDGATWQDALFALESVGGFDVAVTGRVLTFAAALTIGGLPYRAPPAIDLAVYIPSPINGAQYRMYATVREGAYYDLLLVPIASPSLDTGRQVRYMGMLVDYSFAGRAQVLLTPGLVTDQYVSPQGDGLHVRPFANANYGQIVIESATGTTDLTLNAGGIANILTPGGLGINAGSTGGNVTLSLLGGGVVLRSTNAGASTTIQADYNGVNVYANNGGGIAMLGSGASYLRTTSGAISITTQTTGDTITLSSQGGLFGNITQDAIIRAGRGIIISAADTGVMGSAATGTVLIQAAGTGGITMQTTGTGAIVIQTPAGSASSATLRALGSGNASLTAASGLAVVSSATGDVYIQALTAAHNVLVYADTHFYYNHDASVQYGYNNGTEFHHNVKLSAPTKAFVIPHPDKDGWVLEHNALEGPEAAVFYRAEARIGANGEAAVTLPSYTDGLVDLTTAHAYITPLDKPLVAAPAWSRTGKVIADRRDVGTLVSVLLIGKRQDVPDLVPEYVEPPGFDAGATPYLSRINAIRRAHGGKDIAPPKPPPPTPREHARG